MFTQSVIVRGSGFPLFATYVAVIKAAWREVTFSLKGENALYFPSAQIPIDIDQTCTHVEVRTSGDHTESDSVG